MRIKLVVYGNNKKLFLDDEEVPWERLADMTPILVDRVDTKGGVLVVYGMPWYDETDIRPVVVGDIVFVPLGANIIVIAKHNGETKVISLPRSSQVFSTLPYLLSIQVLGKIDTEYVHKTASLLKEAKEKILSILDEV